MSETSSLPKAGSKGEAAFALHCRAEKLEPLREFKFHPERRWRFDFAWPEHKLAVEIEGGVHRIKNKFERDIEKYNTATKMGWRILRYTPKMIKTGEPINEVELMLENLTVE